MKEERDLLAAVEPAEERSDEAGFTAAAPTPDAEVAAKPKRRQFGASYRLRILEEADACQGPGEIGPLLRPEGLYSSHLSWRKARREKRRARPVGRPLGVISEPTSPVCPPTWPPVVAVAQALRDLGLEPLSDIISLLRADTALSSSASTAAWHASYDDPGSETRAGHGSDGMATRRRAQRLRSAWMCRSADSLMFTKARTSARAPSRSRRANSRPAGGPSSRGPGCWPRGGDPVRRKASPELSARDSYHA